MCAHTYTCVYTCVCGTDLCTGTGKRKEEKSSEREG
jgi:hypothetical protein